MEECPLLHIYWSYSPLCGFWTLVFQMFKKIHTQIQICPVWKSDLSTFTHLTVQLSKFNETGNSVFLSCSLWIRDIMHLWKIHFSEWKNSWIWWPYVKIFLNSHITLSGYHPWPLCFIICSFFCFDHCFEAHIPKHTDQQENDHELTEPRRNGF